MAAATSVVEVSNDVRDHGTLVNATRNRVQCSYCSKEVAGFSRLKYHLGQLGSDVMPCQNVPEVVKILIRNSLLEKKMNVLKREVTELLPLDQPLKKRTLSSCSNSSVAAKRKRPGVDSVTKSDTMEMDLESWQEVLVSESASNNIKYEVDLSRPVKRNIARFFIENGIDSSIASSASFKTMVDAIIVRGGFSGCEIPSCDELSSLIQDEMKDIHHYVKE
ncbi:hAT transposon superfamily protein, partial [Thalictrum thalictroides]